MKRIWGAVGALVCAVLVFVCFGVNASAENKILVAYFSCTGNTEKAAQLIAETVHGDLYVIQPEQPYTAADLDYSNASARTTVEQNDSSARPKIKGSVNIKDYDTIFIGYPIWWGKAPKIMFTFLESYDFTGKTVVPFCTSGSSSIKSSEDELRVCAPAAVWKNGKRFSKGVNAKDVTEWVEENKIALGEEKIPEPSADVSENEITVSNAPTDSTLILVLYKETLLHRVRMQKGSGTIRMNIDSPDCDEARAFLWDFEKLIPLWRGALVIEPTPVDDTMKIRVSSSSGDTVYKLNGTAASQSLYKQLPMTVVVRDFSSNEKIFYPPQKLSLYGAPIASGGSGVLAYYEPWGDVVMFYDSFYENESLYELGTAISGEENIWGMSGTVTVTKEE